MRLRRLLCVLTALSVGVLAGCGGDDDGASADASADANLQPDGAPRYDASGALDATPADLTCLDDELPATADDPLTVSGSVFTLDGTMQANLADVLVEAHLIGADPDSAPLAADSPTGSDGAYTLEAESGGAPLEAFLYAVKLVNPPSDTDPDTNYLRTRLYPPIPVAENQIDVPIPVLSRDTLDLLLLFTGGADQDPEKGIIVALVVDCAGEPAAGATVTTDPAAGNVLYANEMGLPSVNRTTTSSQGLVFLLNVPAGDVSIGAEVGGETLREHVVTVVGGDAEDTAYSGEITATAITPIGAAAQ